MEHYQELSAQELKAHLDKLQAEKEALARALEARHEEEKRALADEIRGMITDRGYDLNELVELVLGRKRRNGKTADTNASYARYADPDNPNNTYIRGRLPNWLVEKMSANGYDPTSPEHRAEFKEQHLIKVAA